MSNASEVARIKADFAARNAMWMVVVRARLREGPAITVELAEACGERSRGPFSHWLHTQKRAGNVIAVGSKVGPNGALNTIWGIP